MSTTIGELRLVTANLPKILERASSDPQNKREIDYYLATVGSIKTIDAFLKNDRLYGFAMQAFGLDDMTYAKAFMRKVLTEGIDSRGSFANQLSDGRYRAFAAAFNFARYGASTTSYTAARQGTVDAYVRQTIEVQQGQSNEAVRLALYFQRKAPQATTPYALMADKALLKVTQVVLGLPASSSSLDIDRQSKLIASKLDVNDLRQPAKVDKLLERFSALWDLSNSASTPASSGIVGLSDSAAGLFDSSLLASIQNLKTGS